MSNVLFAVILSLSAMFFGGQTAGAPGRTTGNRAIHGSFTIGGGSNASCTGTTCNGTSAPFSPGSQVMAGNITFSAISADAALNIGGPFGGGSGLFQVSCDGGTTFITIAGCSATLPTTSGTCSYPTPSCSGPTNANTLIFHSVVSGGGGSGYNMNMSPPTTTQVSW